MRRGYTLIEVLAVAALLALAAGVAAPGLLRVVRSDPLAAAGAALAHDERLARRLASGRGALLRLEATGFAVAGDAHAGCQLPDGVIAAWTTAKNAPLRALVVDDRGRSADYAVELTRGERSLRFAVCGLSGEWVAVEDP